MKSRDIQTRYWNDEFITDATWQSRYVFLYILTSDVINLVGIFQMGDKKISLETGLTMEDVEIAKEELSLNKKVLFYNGWVYVPKAFINNPYWKSSKVWKAWETEFTRINPKALEFFNTAIDSDIRSTQESIIRTGKQVLTKKETESEQYIP